MKEIIEIPDDRYKDVIEAQKHHLLDSYAQAVANGTPIPDNATVGEMFCMLTGKEPICDTASYFTIDKELWNSPYQKD